MRILGVLVLFFFTKSYVARLGMHRGIVLLFRFFPLCGRQVGDGLSVRPTVSFCELWLGTPSRGGWRNSFFVLVSIIWLSKRGVLREISRHRRVYYINSKTRTTISDSKPESIISIALQVGGRY